MQNTKKVIIKNAVKCKKCKTVITSKHRHNFVKCKCGAVGVDGGTDYLRRVGKEDDYEELSESADITLLSEDSHCPKGLDLQPGCAICKKCQYHVRTVLMDSLPPEAWQQIWCSYHP